MLFNFGFTLPFTKEDRRRRRNTRENTHTTRIFVQRFCRVLVVLDLLNCFENRRKAIMTFSSCYLSYGFTLPFIQEKRRRHRKCARITRYTHTTRIFVLGFVEWLLSDVPWFWTCPGCRAACGCPWTVSPPSWPLSQRTWRRVHSGWCGIPLLLAKIHEKYIIYTLFKRKNAEDPFYIRIK